MRLSELKTGQKAYITKVNGSGAFRKRILEMGFVRGEEVKAILNAPLKDPIKYEIMDYEVSLRRSEAIMIEISMLKSDTVNIADCGDEGENVDCGRKGKGNCHCKRKSNNGVWRKSHKRIKVALVGNPNSGKTSIFNLASGSHEHVGNYSGVTVDAKEGILKHKGYVFTLVDLPGTYSLSAYSPEELYVRKYIVDEHPDVIVNVVASSVLERNLFLTTELIDMEYPMVIALNMYDELEQSGRKFDYNKFGDLINIPIIPTVGKRGEGIPELLEKIIEVHEKDEYDFVEIPYGRVLEKSISVMERELDGSITPMRGKPLRQISIKLLEGDKDMEKFVQTNSKNPDEILARRDKERNYISKLLREDPESSFTNARYGFIAGGLKQTLTDRTQKVDKTKMIDSVVSNKYLGFPIFFFFMWIMFEATFQLGQYPMEWIEWLVAQLGNFVREFMTPGPLKDLIVDGIIGGVGGVIVFLPNIVILYLFISFMEDSGYMSRAAFIMDKLMHRIGLHGKSFIPLIMGFGCNVPAIMATRTIESRSSRMITMFIVPFMSCSARLPVYILFTSVFFPKHASLVMLGLYIFGILVAALTALLFRKTIFKSEETPFVMELPPYRVPTLKSIFTHMWERSSQYLKKMGGPILIASIFIWFLGYFPRNTELHKNIDAMVANVEQQYDAGKVSETERNLQVAELERVRKIEHQENSYIGAIGKFIEPVMRPLGFDWKISVSLLSGMAAKEIVVSTMGVLYNGDGDDQQSLQTRLLTETHPDGSQVFTPLVVTGLLLFVLIYFPCIATVVAIKEESHSWKWALFSIVYSTGLAWLVAFLVHQIGGLLL
jgi:ferrous iron transport protein B